MSEIRTGGCRCGAVRYRAAGKAKWAAHCHCADCRRQTSASFATWISYPAEVTAWERGAPKYFESTPGVRRGFCAECGTPLCYVGGRWAGEMHFLAATLDDPTTVRPTAHVYLSDALPWVHLADGLKRFARTPQQGPALPVGSAVPST